MWRFSVYKLTFRSWCWCGMLKCRYGDVNIAKDFYEYLYLHSGEVNSTAISLGQKLVDRRGHSTSARRCCCKTHDPAVPLTESDTEECALLIVPAKGHDPSSLTQIVRRKISDELGIHITTIDIIAASQLFKTTSGKIDRAKIRSLYNNLSRSAEAVTQ